MVVTAASNANKPFIVRKNLRSKKKAKVNTITNYFASQKNSQGFDLHLCRYEKKVDDKVYVPKNYGHRAKPWDDRSFCCSCKLQPCITVEYYDEIYEKANQEHEKREVAEKEGIGGKRSCPVAVVDRIANFAMKFMRRHFGSEYVKTHGMPECIIKESHQFNLAWFNCGCTQQTDSDSEAETDTDDSDDSDDSDGSNAEEAEMD